MKLIRYQQPNVHSSLNPFSNLFEDALTSLAPIERNDPAASPGARSPLVTYVENDSGFDFIFEIPGVQREDVNLELKKNVLTVSTGKDVSEKEEESAESSARESAYRYLSRVRLPQHLDTSSAQAHLENGILTVSFPKAAEAKARHIEIN